MDFRTIVDIPAAPWQIMPCERMLFVGSCFADSMGRRFEQEKFRTVVNPYGVMYNPASILHTVERLIAEGGMPFRADEPGTAVFTLGTNRVYVLKETGEIVDNCRKRPPRLFEERSLGTAECADCLRRSIGLIRRHFPAVRFVLTVSPIRYRKYGYHGSQLSKATLLLAADSVVSAAAAPPGDGGESRDEALYYFPSYEIVNDELRDYRFYAPDMLHPSAQAVDYIYERMAETLFAPATHEFLRAWKPIREALAHQPFHPESAEYQAFLAKAREQERELMQRVEAARRPR